MGKKPYTIITEDFATRPHKDQLVVIRRKRHDGSWTRPQIVMGWVTDIGETWWSIDGLFEPPQGE